MKKEEFNVASRAKQWPLIRQIASEVNRPDFKELSSRDSFQAAGTEITLCWEGNEILRGKVLFPVFTPDMHMDALQILLMHIRAQALGTKWDTAVFSTQQDLIRHEDVPPMRKNFWSIAHYADIGLHASLIEVSDTPAQLKCDELYKALLGNAAAVESVESALESNIPDKFLKLVEEALKNPPSQEEIETTQPKPGSKEEFEKMLLDTVGGAIKPEDPQP